ncbi:acyl-CoA thioesterase [Alkalicoccus daliensis]|uniref:Acyl-CoA thioester hydrolase n=1 Tax=Alkalicoccus daliensis TaxID=745820 RepID=A0A1H0AEW4_9BACI|nr:thioesterase family protein [Alkalicoccus daliensis]SDN31543.1 acyl-CoA thioester hydrolase [Alkalicoccus daliensis]
MYSHTETIQVRYAETDQMGVVYHANYLVWCEIGRTGLILALGLSYAEMEESGVLAPVTNVNMNYKYPARYGKDIHVKTWIEDYSGVRVTYGYEISDSDGNLCFDGKSQHVLVDKETFRPLSMKKHFPKWHELYNQNVRA